MSDEIVKSLNRRIEELTGENIRRKQRERDALAKLKEAEGRVAELEKSGGDGSKALEKAEARVKELERSLADAEQAVKDAPSRHADEVKRLKAELLTRDRRAAFDKAAKGKVRDDALADAFERVAWGEDESIDDSKVEAEVDRLVAEKPYLKRGPDGPETDPGGTGKTPPPRPPGPEIDRGAAPGKASETPDFGGRIA
jgi:hypothetical protein